MKYLVTPFERNAGLDSGADSGSLVWSIHSVPKNTELNKRKEKDVENSARIFDTLAEAEQAAPTGSIVELDGEAYVPLTSKQVAAKVISDAGYSTIEEAVAALLVARDTKGK